MTEVKRPFTAKLALFALTITTMAVLATREVSSVSFAGPGTTTPAPVQIASLRAAPASTGRDLDMAEAFVISELSLDADQRRQLTELRRLIEPQLAAAGVPSIAEMMQQVMNDPNQLREIVQRYKPVGLKIGAVAGGPAQAFYAGLRPEQIAVIERYRQQYKPFTR